MALFNIRFLSKSLLRKTEVRLIIPSLDLHGAVQNENPDYYCQDTRTYPLLILLSGFGDDNETWIAHTDILTLCDRYRVAAAFVAGEDKWYVDGSPVDRWHTYITAELPDFLCGTFSKLDRRRLILGGVSMGGYGALYNGLKCPEKFQAVMALSPAVKPDNYIREEETGTLRELFLSAKGKIPPVYLSVGEDDFIYAASRELDGWLRENGTGVRYTFVKGYSHSWDLWKLEIVRFLDFLKAKRIISCGGNAE